MGIPAYSNIGKDASMNLFRNQKEYDSFNKTLCEIFNIDYIPTILENNLFNPSQIPVGLAGEKNGFFGHKHTEETKKKMSLIHSGKTISESQKKKIVESNKTRKYTKQFRKKLSDYHSGKPKSQEHKLKLKLAAKNRIKMECPHCYKTATAGNYKRWHGDNCKLK